MAGIIGCPACGGKFRLPANAKAGVMVRCPHCSQAIRIPGSAQPAGGAVRSTSQPAATLPPDLLSDLPDPLSAPPDPLGPPRRKGRDRTALYVVAGVSGGLVLILTVALVLALSGSRQPASQSDETAVAAAAASDVAAEVSSKSPAAAPKPSVEQKSPAAASDAQSPLQSAQPDSSEPRQADPPAAPAAGAVSAAATPPGGGGLLGLIDPVRDALGGTWTREGSSLVCPGGSRWALVMPEPPPDGYRWTLAVERISGYGAVNLGLVVAGHQTMAVLEGYGTQSSGLNRLDGRAADQNETTWRGPIFQEGRPTTIVCTVGLSRVQVTCDGRTIIDWSGSPERLSFDRSSWLDLPGDRLIVASYQGVNVRISRIELEEVDPGDPAPAAPSPDYAQNRPGRFGSGRSPWWPARPFSQPPGQPSQPPGQPSQPSPQPSEDGESPSPPPSQPAPMIPLEELPEPVARSKESVCIIEHPLGSGTGFVVAENLIATNAHVVDGAYVEEIECHFSAAGVLKCRASRVLYEDAVRDLCLLEVETDQAPIPIKASHVFQRGEGVVIVGNPALGETSFVLRDAVARGTITAVVHTDNCDFYQIDATVNFGSSGGPVLSLDGEVVGVIAMKATERGESELRSALLKLDDHFAARFSGSVRKGIAFGIPVNALSYAIQQVQTQSESAAVQVGQRHMAQVLLSRLSLLGGIYLLQIQVNVPAGVRQQAANIDLSHLSPAARNKIKLVPLLPEFLARLLARELDSEEVQKIVRDCSKGLEGKVRQLSQSEHFDQTIARSLESLHRSVLETKLHLEKPATTYQAFSQAVTKQTDELKTLIRRLSDQLEVAEAAYED